MAYNHACRNKYISVKVIKKVIAKQKELQLREFEKKGKRAKPIKFYEALDALVGVRR